MVLTLFMEIVEVGLSQTLFNKLRNWCMLTGRGSLSAKGEEKMNTSSDSRTYG